MAAETQTLNFGPEWLRALSSGGSITSPPLSPALPKYKLADYRYGREEMLALFLKDNKIPSDLLDKEFLPILQEEPLLPLALVPFTEEEQRNFSMSVNSAAVLRLTGRGGGGTVVGAPRGRSSSRGRGRGRGECGFYQRSFDEVEGVFVRGGGREMHRSQSWEERGDRRFDKPGRKDVGRPNFEEGGPVSVGRKHEFIRSESGNWRIFREEQNGEDEDGGWRLTGSRRDGERWRPHSPDGPRSAGWREHMERRRRFEFDFRDRDDERGYRRVRSGSGSIDDDRDSLPEWCLEDAEEEMGTFDSSGAFLSLKKVQKEPIPEEQEMDFRPVEEGEECSDSEGSHNEEAKEPDKTNKKEAEKTDRTGVEASEETTQTSSSSARPGSPSDQPQEAPQFERKEESKTEQMEKAEEESRTENSLSTKVSSRGDEVVPAVQQPLSQIPSDTASPLLILPPPVPSPSPALRPVETPVVGAPGMGSVPTEPDDEEGLKHLEQQAEKMVAYLQDSALDDERLASKLQEHRAKGVSIPLMHEAMQKWYYKDPQGEIQGPFNNQEMAEWFQAGYFTMSLLVKRACDESFQPLGDIMKMWGRVPFSPGPAPPPHMGELDQERLTRQQELTALYQMQHLQYQQFLIQQQYAQVLAQQQKAALSSQQQQQLALLLQQFQALKMRISDQNIIPSVTRSVSVPDTGSIWELQPAPSQPTVWEGGSVWDLPLDPATPAPALEQLQQMEKAKAAKLEQERREAEMRAKREEEERKRQEELRRQQEEILRRQQEEERKRREEEELARRKQEEALRRQREQEIALRRQREEEERQQQEEALRRLEERRREEEERRKQEELLRKQEEEAAKWAREEEEAQRRLEENRLRMEEEAARLRHEEEERKRKELELQRQNREPGRAAGRRAAGRRHLAVRRGPRGRLPRPAAVSPRALPSGRSRSGLGAARRGPEPGGGPRPEMVICCAAANCSNRQGKGEKRAVSFHRFPLKDSKRLMQWLKAVQRDNWTPTKYSFLCSEHFTKDSFSKRLEDQHRLLKPTAVPSIFHLAEKKRRAGGHGRPRRRDTGKASAGLRAQASDPVDGKAAAGSPSSSSASPMAKPEPRKLKRATPQGRTAARAARETAGQERGRQPLEGRAEDGPASAATSCSQGEAGTGAEDAGEEGATPADSGLVDRSGVSADDFTPPGSGACKFIGSLHSYSFSSKHARERPAVPREPVERKRLRRDAEPGCSGSSPGPEKGPAQSPPRACPSASSSLTATPQKPAQGASAPPTDVTPKPAAEAVQSEHSDASPMSINEVILSASGACKLIDSLHSYCFSSRQSKSQVCCLREQVEKKNGELRTLRQRVSRSDSQVRELRQKLDQLRRLSLPHLSSLLPPGREPPKMSPVVEPLSWMLGTWLSEPPGAGTFPTLQPFRYLEEAHISHVGQPMLNFSFNAFHPDTHKPMHRECGFIRLEPDTNKVAFVSAQNTGIVEVEEGEVNGQELCIASHSIARISFAKEPHVEQITRKFRLNSEGKLEQTVSMATTTQPLTQHLHVTYKKVTP